MAIVREYTKKSVMVISDTPLVKEVENDSPYSENSSSQLKDALIQASITEHRNKDIKHHLGLNEVCFTYLSTTRPDKGDSDWTKSIVSKKNIPHGEEYIQCEWLKDVWVSAKVWKNIQGLVHQIKQVQPELIVCAGKWAFLLFATLSSEPTAQLATIAATKTTFKKQVYFGALNKYRASLLTLHSYFDLPTTVVIPILTPSYHWVVRDKAMIIKSDYARIAYIYGRIKAGITPEDVLKPKRTMLVGDTKQSVLTWLTELYAKVCAAPLKVVFDVETRQQGIDRIGICYKPSESFTIPITQRHYITTDAPSMAYVSKTVVGKKVETYEEVPAGTDIVTYSHYWGIDDEVAITYLLHKIMLHPNCLHVGQNYIYDCQFYFREWKLKINAHSDTMIQHHVLFNYMQKDLALLASMYCSDFVYWKSEIHDKDDFVRSVYCGKDCAYTLSINNTLERFLLNSDPKLQEFYDFQQNHVCKAVVTMMNRGVDINNELKTDMYNQFSALMEGCLEKLRYVFNEPEFNPNSTPQVKAAFKDLLGIKPLVNRKTKSESFGADAMLVYLEEYPEWRSLLTLFLEYKSIKVFVRTFLGMKVSADGKLRCSYNPAGTKTYRFSSRKDIDGNGGNLANIPSKGKIDLRYALQEIQSEDDSNSDLVDDGLDDGVALQGKIVLPNCKTMFIPPVDWIMFDADYSAIDLHFVVWESDCKFLKKIIKDGKDTYAVLASHYYQREIVKVQDEVTGKWDWPKERQTFKAVGHGSNYLGKPTTLAAKAGLAVPQVKRVQDWYFGECPEIPAWHAKIDNDCKTKRYTTNVFGARFWCMDFTDPMYLNKMVAAVPQSSAAILVNKALCTMEETEKGNIKALLQVHDSIVGMFHKDDTTALDRIKGYLELEIPYANDPLIIPANIVTSSISYGDCH